jgi:hypothetical protein
MNNNRQTIELPEFKPVELKDKSLIKGFNHKFSPMSCEYSFANLFAWRDIYDISWTLFQERLILHDGVEGYTLMPLGPAMEPTELVDLSLSLVKAGKSGNIALVPAEYVTANPDLNNYYTLVEDPDYDDYLYSTEALAELKGKKLHKKRNLISQFNRLYPDAGIEGLTPKVRDICLDFAKRLHREAETVTRTTTEEQLAIKEAFTSFEPLGLEGIAILVDGAVRAFAVFSPLNEFTFDIHFEKADFEFKGVSQAINRATAIHLRDRCRLINREQDLGIPGLRHAKRSYEPLKLFKTFALKLR